MSMTLSDDPAPVLRYAMLQTQLGLFRLVASDEGLVEIDLAGGAADSDQVHDPASLADPLAQLSEYFAGRRRTFDLRLAARGTPFQRRVWRLVYAVPFGSTTSYGALARQLGKPGAARAVGLANGRNPLPIVVPCHRVIGARRTLTGYAGGLELKRALLDLEGVRLHTPEGQLSLFGGKGR